MSFDQSKMQSKDTSSNNILKDRAVKFRCLPSVKSEGHAQQQKRRSKNGSGWVVGWCGVVGVEAKMMEERSSHRQAGCRQARAHAERHLVIRSF